MSRRQSQFASPLQEPWAGLGRFCAPTIILAACGLIAWLIVILLPIVTLAISVRSASVESEQLNDIHSLLGSSIGTSALIAGLAALIGFLPGKLLASVRTGKGWVLLLILMPLLLPKYLLYYSWSLLLSPINLLGNLIAENANSAQLAGELTSSAVIIFWYWPLAALVISQGWRAIDNDVRDQAQLEAGSLQRFLRVTLPMLTWSIVLAFVVCFTLCLGEFGTFHLAGIQTLGTELAVLYELTGSVGAVVRAAWPICLIGVLAGILLWRGSGLFFIDKMRDTSHEHPGKRPSRWLWIILGLLVTVSLIGPIVVLLTNFNRPEELGRFLTLHADGLGWSLLIALLSAGVALLISAGVLALQQFGRIGRAISALACVTIFIVMFLPGSIVGVSIVKLLAAIDLPSNIQQGWFIVSAGLAARFAGIALILLRIAQDSRARRLGELAATDGAGSISAWWYIHLPTTWPVLAGAILVVTMFAMTELPATMVLLPAGVPNFAQRLLNQMHYARDQHVIASCLILIGSYILLAFIITALLRFFRLRSRIFVVVLLCSLCVMGSGCDDNPGQETEPDIVGIFGTSGRGKSEFLYPRAIELLPDGSIFVLDKAGYGRQFRDDKNHTPMNMFKMPKTDNGKPTGVTAGPGGSLFIADTHNHRVLIITPAGEVLGQFGKYGQGSGEFIYPTDVALARDGRIFVSEYGSNDRVSVFSPGPEYEFLFSFGQPGPEPGQFARPSALCIDHNMGVLYVADACNHRIGVYSLDGKLLRYIGSPGQAAGQLRYPYDLALLSDGKLVVSEYGNNRIQIFTTDGQSVGTLGQAGREVGQLAYPWGVAASADDRIFIVDSGNNRIQVWQL